ncbi:MAG: hypothetical protein E7540_02765 [Ruminococcaceae bacterium]|nr:hypothetical protein [Oscillospiraceae bacterium]
MAYTTVHNGVIFIEGAEPDAKRIGSVEYKKEGFYNQQLKGLDVVKDQLAVKARKMGGNAVMDFKYGQKSTGWFRSMLLSYDDNINWYGTGTVILLSQDRYDEIVNSKK